MNRACPEGLVPPLGPFSASCSGPRKKLKLVSFPTLKRDRNISPAKKPGGKEGTLSLQWKRRVGKGRAAK